VVGVWGSREGPGVSGKLVLRGGLVVTKAGLERLDLGVEGGIVTELAPSIDPPVGAAVLDCSGCWVGPGLVDVHTHLREPGDEDSETILSGSLAAARGGYCAVVAMPNTSPPIDSPEAVLAVRELTKVAPIDVEVASAITVGRRGEELVGFFGLARMGVRIFTDDGSWVADAGLMRRALELSRVLGVVVAEHCEDPSLSKGGVAGEGPWQSLLGLGPWPPEAEEVAVARDLVLAHRTGGRLHLMHISRAGSLAMLRAAKANGMAVSAEVSPHHLALTDRELSSFDPYLRVNPPLGTAEDRSALKAAFAQGVLDVYATDHAPHAPYRKQRPFGEAAPGAVGLETAFAVLYQEMGEMGAPWLYEVASTKPARLAGLEANHGGPLEPGRPASLCVFDPSAEWVVDASELVGKSKNTAFLGRRLRGRVRHTIHQGRAVVEDGRVVL
jgi:dihydroorotase